MGSNDYVTIPRSIQDSFSISFWFKPEANGTEIQVSGTEERVWLMLKSVEPPTTLEFLGQVARFILVWGIDQTIHASGVSLNEWHQVTATRDKSTGSIALYIDGDLKASGTGSTRSLASPGRITLGILQTMVNGYFKGEMDSLQLWSKALNSTEVQANFNSEPDTNNTDLEAYYKFDEGSGTTISSATGGSSLNGTLINGTAWTTGRQGVSNGGQLNVSTNGNNTSYSDSSIVLSTTVTAVNDAPINSGSDKTLETISEDADQLAQVNRITLDGNYEEGDQVKVTINGKELSYSVTASDIGSDAATTRDNIGAGVAAVINADLLRDTCQRNRSGWHCHHHSRRDGDTIFTVSDSREWSVGTE